MNNLMGWGGWSGDVDDLTLDLIADHANGQGVDSIINAVADIREWLLESQQRGAL